MRRRRGEVFREQTNVTFLQAVSQRGECTCELGVYGVHLSDCKEELVNEAAGHLLRVKLQGVDEGGVCAGFAVLSSPVMC